MFFEKIREESLVNFSPYFVIPCIREQIYKKKKKKLENRSNRKHYYKM